MTSMTGSRGPTGGNVNNTSTGKFSGDRIPEGYKAGQLQQYTPEQMDLFQQQFSNLGPDSYLARLAGGDQSFYDEMEAPALRQFSGIQGGLASRFSGGGQGRGSMSSRRSSGFQNTQTAAASNFAQELQAKRQGLRQQAIKDLYGMSSDLLEKRPYERFLEKEEQQGGWGGAASGAVSGGTAGSMFGPWGTVIGAGVGGVAGYFSKK